MTKRLFSLKNLWRALGIAGLAVWTLSCGGPTGEDDNPILSVDPDSLNFGEDHTSRILTISNTGKGVLHWSLEVPSEGWISVSQREGNITITPVDVDVRIDRTKAPVGEQEVELTISAQDSTKTVVLRATIRRPGILTYSPDSLDFGDSSTQKTLTLQNEGGEELGWEIAADQLWITIPKNSGTLQPGTKADLNIQIDRADQSPGSSLEGVITLTEQGGMGNSYNIKVIATMPNPPVLSVAPEQLDFDDTQNSLLLTISNTGAGLLHWSIEVPSEGWISVSQREGNITNEPINVDVRIDRSTAPVGEQEVELVISAQDSTKTVVLRATIRRPGILTYSPDSLDFGDSSTQETLTLQNEGDEELGWEIATDQLWIIIPKNSGILQPGTKADLNIQIDRADQSPGSSLEGVIILTEQGGMGNIFNIEVIATMPNPPVLAVAPEQLDFDDTQNSLLLTISNTGAGTLEWELTVPTQDWLEVNRRRGEALSDNPSIVTLEIDRSLVGSASLELELTSNGGSKTIPLLVAASNTPVANAGPDQIVEVNTQVSLDGRSSSDADGDELTYSWKLTEGSGVSLSDPTAVQPAFTPSTAGSYKFVLEVHDGKDSSDPDEVEILVDTRPEAVAGPDQRVNKGDTVSLDGRSSRDADEDNLTYIWIAPAEITLSDERAAQPRFEAPDAGTYLIKLTVNDGYLDSDPDSLYVQINTPPIANAGADQKIQQGALVELDGRKSQDVDGDILTYAWTQQEGPNVTLSNDQLATSTFEASDAGVYLFSLIVDDGWVQSLPDEVLIRVNIPPEAVAGPSQLVETGTVVTLDGSGSHDADGDALTYLWSQKAGPNVPLSDNRASNTTLIPEVAGTYTFALVVNDSFADSESSMVDIQVDTRPVARAGEDQWVTLNDRVTLDGSGSRDADGDALTYAWEAPANIALDDPGAEKPSFVASTAGPYDITLVVRDGIFSSDPSVTTVHVNTPPVAIVGDDQEAIIGTKILLDGTGSNDADGDPLSYIWTQIEGASVTLSDPASAQSNFTPTEIGSYVFQLKVNDGQIDSEENVVTITITPLRFADANLEEVIREALNNHTGDITQEDLLSLTRLDASVKEISHLSGMEYLTLLTWLDLHANQISDVGHLSSLTLLTWLDLENNQISDLSPLANLTNLTEANLQRNQIDNLQPLATWIKVENLYLTNNRIKDINSLASLSELRELDLENNQVRDISSLSHLERLIWLGLRDNEIEDISALVENAGLGNGDQVDIRGNPLDQTSLDVHIPTLEERGVIVNY